MEVLFNNPLLSTAYLPPAEYLFVLAHSEKASIEYHETFQKQSYRTRCNIYATDGLFTLQVPVCHTERHSAPICETRIDYTRNWVHQHETALISAYKSSPFFEYYWDDFKTVLESKPVLLTDLNTALTELLIKEMELDCKLSFTTSYVSDHQGEDLRNTIHPKFKGDNIMKKNRAERPYYQVFSARYGFIPNLSSIDLLFNEGPNVWEYLKA